MNALQTAKKVVRQFHSELESADSNQISDVLSAHVSQNCIWRGVHPFGELEGVQPIAETFWMPLKAAMPHLKIRDVVFFAGANEIDHGGTVWVVSMGHLVGLFDAHWLGIRPTRKTALVRYCAFHRVEQGSIAESVMHVDIPDLMAQSGQNPFPPQTGAALNQPGPATQDGLLFSPQPEAESTATLAVINSMIRNLGRWQSGLPLREELALDWHDDMAWWGPAGIGSAFTIDRYARQHAGPFRASFANRSETRHIARLAEGHYGGFFGWPNFTAEPVGGFMGMPATGKPGEFRVIDIYRRAGEKLAENWVFIDLLHFWKQQGVDFLARHADLD
ncbi:ester cyclase [Nitratireductor sp. XY-223]|uniref:ester cyclase n=1 Tax=Nitratireductor sp. XY-223 TaxID=2561926 RepID=UPI0010AA4F96|nr:ester cyclase [Nitratireductor sp. XY-223]